MQFEDTTYKKSNGILLARIKIATMAEKKKYVYIEKDSCCSKNNFHVCVVYNYCNSVFLQLGLHQYPLGRQQEIIPNTEELQANTSHEQTFA